MFHHWFIPQYQHEIGYYTTDYSIDKDIKKNNKKHNNHNNNHNLNDIKQINYLTLVVPNELAISKVISGSNDGVCAEVVDRPKETIILIYYFFKYLILY